MVWLPVIGGNLVGAAARVKRQRCKEKLYLDIFILLPSMMPLASMGALPLRKRNLAAYGTSNAYKHRDETGDEGQSNRASQYTAFD
jgi:hypothetical protein